MTNMRGPTRRSSATVLAGLINMRSAANLCLMIIERIFHSTVQRLSLDVINGFSKLYAMIGLRLGCLIAPKVFIRPIQKIQQNFLISANSVMQKAGIAALEKAADDVVHVRTVYDERRRYMTKRLKKLGFGITVEPTGAFYVFANAKYISGDSYKLAFDVLEKAHVGVAPGIDFGSNGEGYLRFSYANSMNNIVEGLNRIEWYLDTGILCRSTPLNDTGMNGYES